MVILARCRLGGKRVRRCRLSAGRPAIGFIGLGDQGLPMAKAIAAAGFPLHVWARRRSSLDALGDMVMSATAILRIWPPPATLWECASSPTMTSWGSRTARSRSEDIDHHGGTQAVAQRCREVFHAFFEHVVDLGSSGSGQTTKLTT